ncbi:RQC-minor-2 family DNA-binding protein [Halobacillus salinus]|uniref:RQC domain-containing protein n=1 Tax=Halobacillus salinus TaxID=192814 RepID=A0A4Z0H0Y8_9BACI|nr:RQC-minor-2 family DNA-binding protein [Halobacillus salinus]TGB02717.1 hypothetical protein E4663_11190 [Halobacillus salinus]
MGLPERITYQDERYPLLALAPIGKKNKQIRSIGHKFERGLLSRLNDTIMDHIYDNEWDVTKIRAYLNLTGEAVLPVSLQKDETVYPHLLRPELFLWRSLPAEHGLPLKEEFLYHKDFTHLSAEQLYRHIGHVLEDYMFLADVSKHTREHWLKRIADAFHNDPLIRLIHEKREVIESVETMNQSALLSVLKYPEDISYWRHRVEIVMRPYRAMPEDWLDGEKGSCSHEKELHFDSHHRTICCSCEICDFHLYYHVDHHCVSFEEDFDVERAEKRMNTIEKQFNEIAEQNTRLLDQLDQLRALRKKLAAAANTLDESLDTVQLIERYQQQRIDLQEYPVLDMYNKIKHITIPARKASHLLWLSDVELEDVTIFKELPKWLEVLPNQVYPLTHHVLDELQEKLEEVRYGEEDIILTVKGHSLTYAKTQQILDLIHYYGTDYPAHTLTQVLSGKATNKLRTLKLHETRWFGLLSDWPEKHVQKLFNQLEKQGWLMKQQKGYSVSDYAEEVM